MAVDPVAPEIAALLARGEEEGCLELSELDGVVQRLDLSDDQAQMLHEEATSRGIDVRDDCGREAPEPVSYRNGELADATTDALQLFMNEVGRHALLTKGEEVELAQAIERGGLKAKERLVSSNLRLVISNARKYQNQGLSLLDLIQEGILGLIRATEKFDWRRGYKFSTYATFWIRQALQRSVETKARSIKLPIEMAQRERKIARVERELAAKLGRDPTDEEVADRAEVTPEQLERLRGSARTVTSLDRPVGEEGDSTLGEFMASDQPGPEEEVDLSLREATVRQAVTELPEPEREVVKLRYGINGDEPTPLAETGRRLGMSHEQVRRLESRALKRLATRRELAALDEAA